MRTITEILLRESLRNEQYELCHIYSKEIKRREK